MLRIIPSMAEEPPEIQEERTHSVEARIYFRAFTDEEAVAEDEMTLYYIDKSITACCS